MLYVSLLRSRQRNQMKITSRELCLFLATVLVLNGSVAFSQRWIRQSPYPADDQLNDIHVLSETVSWIVGEDGIVMRTLDGGITWQQHSGFPRSPFSVDDALNQVQFVDSQIGFIGGSNVFRSDDGGENWVDMGFHGQVRHMQFVTPDVGFITTNGGLRRTTDGAMTFETIFNVVSHFSFLNENEGIVSSGGNLFRTENGGDTWSMVSTMGMTRLLLLDQNNVVGSGLNNLFRSSDGGATWTTVATSENNFSDITRIGENSVAAVDLAGGIFISVDGGSNWTQTQNTIGSWAPVGSVHFAPGGSVGFSALSGGVIMKSSDAGQTWAELSSGAAVSLFDIQMTNAGFGIAVGADLTVLRTTDYGRKWHARKIQELSVVDLSVVQIIDSNTIVVAGKNSAFYRSEDGGQTWHNLSGGLPGGWEWNGLSFVDENLGWLFGRSDQFGAIYHTTDGGQNWDLLRSTATLGEGEMVNSDFGWAVDFQTHLVVTNDNWVSLNERDLVANDIYFEMDLVNENVGWVIGTFEQILKSTDGGSTFQSQTHPGYDEDAPEQDQIEDIFALNENEVYLALRNEFGIQYCTIHRSLDAGETWTALNPCGDPSNQFGGRVSEITVLPTGEIWVASVSDGFIWASDLKSVIPGDVNGDGDVNLLDVAPFVDLLSSGQFQAEADINGDGMVNLLDVGPFIDLLSN